MKGQRSKLIKEKSKPFSACIVYKMQKSSIWPLKFNCYIFHPYSFYLLHFDCETLFQTPNYYEKKRQSHWNYKRRELLGDQISATDN